MTHRIMITCSFLQVLQISLGKPHTAWFYSNSTGPSITVAVNEINADGLLIMRILY